VSRARPVAADLSVGPEGANRSTHQEESRTRWLRPRRATGADDCRCLRETWIRSGPAVTLTPLNCGNGSGPKGIRTPDLLAARHTGLNGVLTCGYAGRGRANSTKLSGQRSAERRRPRHYIRGATHLERLAGRGQGMGRSLEGKRGRAMTRPLLLLEKDEQLGPDLRRRPGREVVRSRRRRIRAGDCLRMIRGS
jgi:hypothetical protein